MTKNPLYFVAFQSETFNVYLIRLIFLQSRLLTEAVHLVATFPLRYKVAGKVLRKRPTLSHSSEKILTTLFISMNFSKFKVVYE
jgi:hypothetical protein